VNNANQIILSERLRPQTLGDLTLSQRDIARLQKMIDTGSIMNMIFYGQPGIGKTSAARLIAQSTRNDTEINGSSDKRIDVLRSIKGFAATVAFNPGLKVCFVDEADHLPASTQADLRYVIENTSQNCRFLFTVNNVSKINSALRSRMKQICFDISPAGRSEVIDRLIARYETLLPELGIQFDSQRLKELVGIYFPDLRSIANQVEFEFA